MRGRPRLNPDHVLSNRERVQRWREKHGKLPAPKPPKPDPFPGVKTFEELVAGLEQRALRSRSVDRLNAGPPATCRRGESVCAAAVCGWGVSFCLRLRGPQWAR
jgi:hypothetical protein